MQSDENRSDLEIELVERERETYCLAIPAYRGRACKGFGIRRDGSVWWSIWNSEQRNEGRLVSDVHIVAVIYVGVRKSSDLPDPPW